MAIVYLNGRYLDERKAFVSIHDAGFLFGEGVYETLRTREGKVENGEAHLGRLGQSMEAVGLPVGLPMVSRATLKKALQVVVNRNGFWKNHHQETRLRLTVSGGVHDFDGVPTKPTVLITATVLPRLAGVKVRGVSAISFRAERFMPSIKTTNLLPALLARRAMRKAKAYEVLFVNHRGAVTEGAISNLFWVKREVLCTPKSNLLSGTTREQIVRLARRLQIRVAVRNVRLATLYGADELFVCNAPRGIVPVVKLDGRKIGRAGMEGKVGEVTRRLMEYF